MKLALNEKSEKKAKKWLSYFLIFCYVIAVAGFGYLAIVFYKCVLKLAPEGNLEYYLQNITEISNNTINLLAITSGVFLIACLLVLFSGMIIIWIQKSKKQILAEIDEIKAVKQSHE